LLACESLRFGIAVPRRQARRAVARNMVKRVLREAARAALPALLGACRERAARADVLLRLKRALPGAATVNWVSLKRELRAEADELMGQLERRLDQHGRGAPAGDPARALAQSALGAVKRAGSPS
jgi:ribonuclease P protein component